MYVLLNSVRTANECRTKCCASHAQHCCLSPWVTPPPLPPPLFFSFWTVCASSVHLPECTSPYILEVNYWIPLPLHSGQFSLLWIDVHWVCENVNRNYQPSSNRVESVRCVIPISPLDIKNAPWIQRGNIMLVSWIWLARQNLRRGYTRPWVSLLFFSIPAPSALLPVHLALISPSFLSHSVLVLFSSALSDYNCTYCVRARK